MPDSIWSGTLTFGLVTIPVQLVPAISRGTVSLKMLHRKEGSPLERKMVRPEDEEVVPREDQVRGFQLSKGEYVVITDEELESLAPERSRAIEIEEFVALEEMDPLYFDKPYYLIPERGAERPYRLLVRALRDQEKAGLARFVLRAREHLVAVWVIHDALCLTTLHFQRQRVSPEGLVPEKTRVSRDDLRDLKGLIEEETREFDPTIYDDENELRLLKLIRKKGREKGVENAPRAKGRKKPSEKRLVRKVNRKIREVESES